MGIVENGFLAVRHIRRFYRYLAFQKRRVASAGIEHKSTGNLAVEINYLSFIWELGIYRFGHECFRHHVIVELKIAVGNKLAIIVIEMEKINELLVGRLRQNQKRQKQNY